MTRPKRLLALAISIVVLTLYWGCSQPEDIFTDKSMTVIHLDEERLPSNPPGMIYSLGVAESLVHDSVYQAELIADFGYSFETLSFLTSTGETRPDSNRFVLDADIMEYGYLFVSVQRTDGSGPEIGPILLIDRVIDPEVDAFDMKFPLIGGNADTVVGAARFHMNAVSDDASRGDTNSVNAGAAVWFNTMQYLVGSAQDTTAMLSFTIDTIWRDDLGDDSCRISIVGIDTANVRDTVIKRGFGLDTVLQTIILYEPELHEACIDAAPPYLTTDVDFEWEVGAVDSFRYHDHVQIGGPFLDLANYGWQYKGWVVSDIIEDRDASIGDMTPPAWYAYNSSNDSLLRGIDGGLISTGAFGTLYAPDEGNPYVDTIHIVPPYPGEDFLFNLPNGAQDTLNLVPGGGSRGSVFISLEPSNALTDTTNFPLIVNARSLPGSRAQIDELRVAQEFVMRVFTNVNAGGGGPVLQGMPRIRVTINRI